ncbi:CaiB/BaiF CoA-transferase family protein [Oceanicoccus sp. KOV_DT_Chl]|uniref:CaiB/BaiF CoA transferase family protein n=1 Tax=Oceanicoccus sp. KOV_DT_Chl TaxID=1904639 RepID=UPI000C7D2834|nr:CoA transferase [Oceanicoccus sp. KOV_DT_Chl]
MASPLDGIKVIEMTSVVLGPYACQMLGDLGADVIKVEPIDGDTNRNLGPHRNDAKMGSMFLGCNRNKRSIALDLKSDDGKAALRELLKGADVMVHNFRPQAIDRLGFSYEAVKEISADIVYCGAYGYAKEGPYGEKGALDDSIQAASGVAMLQSMVEGEPRYLPTIVADKTTAMMVVQSVLAALFHRERSGEGQAIEVPMFETMASYIMTEHLWGLSFEPPIGEAGYVRLMAKHRRPYKTKDGLYLAVLPYWDNHWNTFCELAGRPELAADPRFLTMGLRLQNINESYKATGEIIATRSRKEWLDLLGETKVPMMVVNTLNGLVEDEHLVATGFWQEFDHPSEGRIRMSKPPMNFSKTPAEIRVLPPLLGQNSVEVLLEAGVDQTKIDAMLAAGTLKKPA